MLVEALVALDVPPLALDAGVADAQISRSAGSSGSTSTMSCSSSKVVLVKSANDPSGRSSAHSCSIPYRNRVTGLAMKAMRPVTGSASSSRTRAVSPGRRTPAQRAITGGSST